MSQFLISVEPVPAGRVEMETLRLCLRKRSSGLKSGVVGNLTGTIGNALEAESYS